MYKNRLLGFVVRFKSSFSGGKVASQDWQALRSFSDAEACKVLQLLARENDYELTVQSKVLLGVTMEQPGTGKRWDSAMIVRLSGRSTG